MRDIASVTLSGNLTREVELRDLPSGKEVSPAPGHHHYHHPPALRR